MAAIWFRCYTDIKRDRKLRRLPIAHRWIWVAVMAMAKESPIQGRLLISENIPATIEDIADEAAADIEETEKAIQKFIEQDMLHEENGVLVLTNWGKRQYTSDNSTKRVRKHRQRKKETLQQRYSNDEVTPPETETDTETETDPEIKEKETRVRATLPNLTQTECEALKMLKSVANYPFDHDKDLDYLRTLFVDFPSVEALNEIKKWCTYKLDHPLKKASNPRLQLRNWFENAVKWRRRDSVNARAPTGQRNKHFGENKREFDEIDFSKFEYKEPGV